MRVLVQISFILSSFVIMAGCSVRNAEQPAMSISLNDVSATESSLTFTVEPHNVTAASYLVRRDTGKAPSAKYLMVYGTPLVPDSVETLTVDGLEAGQDYAVYVAGSRQGEYVMDAAVVTTKGNVPEPPSSSVTWCSLLEEMLSFDKMTRFPSIRYASRQASSYDRRSVSPNEEHWCANDDGWGYERMEVKSGHEEKVIFDERHPGVISRIWLTSFGSPKTIVRFYLDGASEPTWQMNSFDLNDFASGSGVTIGRSLVFPDAAWIRGSSLYLPISYSKGCKITIEELVEPTTVSRYYHINYRRYPDDVSVETLTPEVLSRNASLLAKVNDALSSPTVERGEEISSVSTVKAGGQFRTDIPEGPKAVDLLEIEVATENASDLQKCIGAMTISGVFDGKVMFELPLVEFFGAGEGGYYLKSWRFSVNGRGKFTARWKMPYRQNAAIVLGNGSRKDVSVSVRASVSTYSWDDRSLYFHAFSHLDERVPLCHFQNYKSCIDWKFAHISGGRGILVGDVYTINNPFTEWPGEGDEKIWVDDESFPSHFGTGVEDYYSFCGYFRFHTPFSGEPRLDASNFKGYNVHYRTRNLDAVPFDSRLRFDLEMLGWAQGDVSVRGTVFWYGDAGTNAE